MDREKGAIIIGKLLHISGMLQKSGNRMLRPFNLNQQQSSIFFEIAKAGKVKQKDMVNRLSLEKANVSKVVKKLEIMGLLEISLTEEDKRSCWLSPTPKGLEIHKACTTMFGAWNEKWLTGVKPEKIDAIIDNLSLLQEIFIQNTKDQE